MDPKDAVRAVATEREPRPGNMLSGEDMYEQVCAYFDTEVDVPSLKIEFYLQALRSDDLDKVVAASMAASLNCLGIGDLGERMGMSPDLDWMFHTFAALRITLDCRFAELRGEQSAQRIKLN